MTATPNLKIQRHVIELLQAEFLEKEGRYRSGWTDQQVATTAGTSLEVVKLVRREAFGDLQEEDPEVASIKHQFADLAKLVVETKEMFNSELTKLDKKISDFVVARRKSQRGA